MLEIKNLHKNFDGVQAVQDLSVSIEPGKITSLIGPNGAGKSTVFNIVSGFLTTDTGTIDFNGTPLVHRSPWNITKLGISRTFQNLRLFRRLTAQENVMLGRQNQSGEKLLNAVFSFSPNSKEHKNHLRKSEELLELVGLADKKNDFAENLSYGQQKLLSIACALAPEPKLLLLDEPVSGVQHAMVEQIRDILKRLLHDQKKTVFLIEHDIEFVLGMSDAVVVMDEGKKIAEGTPSVIKNNPAILEAYLS